ncbi:MULTISPECIES: hypothetical protein [unclassified Kribbella]|uniref:hypothetical protein n=1 Tax=unclassified Kribbella TaxID=2644121 RepID=UPI00301B4C0C
MNPHERGDPSYQVVVQGELRPPLLAFCAGPLAHHKTSGAFRLRVVGDQGIADLAAMLQAADLVILSIRQVTPWEVAVSAGLSV